MAHRDGPLDQVMSKRPESVLVVLHVAGSAFLLLRRAGADGFWQSVTGSLEDDETPHQAALREVREETGIELAPGALLDHRLSNRFVIPPRWRGRYAAGVTHNAEHLFSAALAHAAEIRCDPGEHEQGRWVELEQALQLAWSWTNRDGIRLVAANPGRVRPIR